jgi:hypothetical protein
MVIFCKVNSCCFPNEHVTFFHQCYTCKLFGHGQTECRNNFDAIEKLAVYYLERIPNPLRCAHPDCKYNEFHTTKGHCCAFCGSYDMTHTKRCPANGTKFIDEHVNKEFLTVPFENMNLPNGTCKYFLVSGGCTLFARNNNDNIEYFFLDGDAEGQYGYDTSDIPSVNAFKLGYMHIDNLIPESFYSS